jgi:pre-rRNA-processing protein TSR4
LHQPIYLDTLFEYIAGDNVAARKNKKTNDQQESGNGGGGAENQWGAEMYEKTKGIDDVFARFVSRVENEPQQCIR